MPSILERWRAMRQPTFYYYVSSGDAPTAVLNYTAQKLYQTQDNLQAVVNYLSNSIAQLPLKVYTRDGETDRKRDRESIAARTLYRPNSDQTSFEFIRALAVEYFVFGTVYVWVLPDPESETGFQLRILPSEWIVDSEMDTAYAPATIRVKPRNSGYAVDVPRDEFVQFRTYSAGSPGGYISPIAALRGTLQEQIESGTFRRQLWRSSGRLNAQIVRPKDVQPWDDATRQRWVKAFRESWGPDGAKAGSIPLMEDGMEIKPYQTSFKEQQWAESIQLSRESVAAAYGLNPALLWHTGTQTYASAKDNARALYAECLGPMLQMLQQRINSFLLPKIGADPNTYVEFDLTEKLKGSFEERASILQSAVGGPWMTRNEARADSNLPPVEGGDDLIVPLNVIEGGQASPTDTHMDAQEPMAIIEASGKSSGSVETKAAPDEIRIKATATEEEDKDMAEVVRSFFKRQRKSILPKIGAGLDWWDEDRWVKELADDIEPEIDKVSDSHGKGVANKLGTAFNEERTRAYLRAMAEGRALAINRKTKEKIDDEMDEDEPDLGHVFDLREGKDADVIGKSLTSAAAGWAIGEAVRQAQDEGFEAEVLKEWVTGENPRPTHAAMNGERVPIDEPFSNGAMWPGDDNLDADETCGCNCSTEVIIRR